MSLIPTEAAGVFAIPELGRTIKITEWEEKDIYDTVVLPAATQLAGNEIEFFTDVETKKDIDSNMRTGGKMPARHELIVMKPSVMVLPMWGTAVPELADQIAIFTEGIYVLEKNAKPQVTATHLWRMQSGYGIVAYGLNVTGAATPVAPSSLGVASPAAIPPLLIPFTLVPDDDFNASIKFEISRAGVENNAGAAAPSFTSYTLTVPVAVKSFLHGFVKSPGTK